MNKKSRDNITIDFKKEVLILIMKILDIRIKIMKKYKIFLFKN